MAKRGKGPPEVARTLQVDDGDGLRNRALQAAAERLRRPALVVMLGPDVGERARVTGSSFVIGRSGVADLVLSDPRVSSRHCRLEDRGDGWALVDLGSTNGTFVDGVRVTETILHSNDKIDVGGETIIRFELQDAADRAYDEILERLIHVDDLTGLYLRRRFDRELEELLRRALERNTPLGMLVMDLDGLKAINDAHGHLFGAYVIAESGKLIGRVIPEGAIASRFGGDEYVAAFPGLDLEATARVGEAILEAIRAYPFEREGVRLRPGISIGASAHPEHGSDPLTLFTAADSALYEAKRAGKNRVCVRRVTG